MSAFQASARLWPARLHHLRRDSAEPERLARFYGELLGDRVEALPDGQWLVQGHGRRLVVGKGARGAVPYFALAMREISAIGWIVPTSLLAVITLTSVVSGPTAASSAPRSSRPSRSTGR